MQPFTSLTARGLRTALLTALLCASVTLVPGIRAGGRAPDPTPSPSPGGGAGGGGGGGGGSRKPGLPPAPAPLPIVTATLTFTPVGTYYDVVPQCTGSYRIDPYYPTLSLLTVNVQASSINAPDGTLLYVYVHSAYGTVTSNAIPILSGSGVCTASAYVVPGTIVQSVVVTDSTGAVLSNGN